MPKDTRREAKKFVKVETVKTSKGSTDVHYDVQFAQQRHLTYSRYNGEDLIHVREFEVIGNRSYPTKKGVSFTPGRLKMLMAFVDEIDEHLKQQMSKDIYKVSKEEDYRKHLGAGIHAGVSRKFDGGDLRRYWLPNGQKEIVATKNGIFLPSSQWTALKEKLGDLMIAKPELSIADSCFHQNQLGLMDCHECDPFGSFREQYGSY